MTELDLLQHARAWLRARIRLQEGGVNADNFQNVALCEAISRSYESLADELRDKKGDTDATESKP